MYGFDCSCEACVQGLDRESERFKQLAVDGETQVPPRPQEDSDERRQRARLLADQLEAQLGGDETADSAVEEDAKKEIAVLLKILEVRKSFLHKFNVEVVRTQSALASSALVSGNMPIALKHTGHLCEAYEALYEPNHPIVAVQLSIFGELLALCNKEEPAREALREAKRIFSITHGPTSSVCVSISDRLSNIGTEET